VADDCQTALEVLLEAGQFHRCSLKSHQLSGISGQFGVCTDDR
jgi:hypothetical protein